MTTNFDFIRPMTIAKIMAELITDHSEKEWDDEYTFPNPEVRALYQALMSAGLMNCGNDFLVMLTDANDIEGN